MHIAFVIGSLTGGGAERVVALLSNEFVNEGHEVSIVSIASKKKTYELSDKVKLFYCVKKYRFPGISFLRRVCDINTILEECNPDICISFTVAVNIYAILANLGKRRRLIVCERNDPKFDPQSKVLRILRRLIYGISDGFVFQTTGERDYFSERIRSRSWVIPNPINSNIGVPFTGERQKKFVTAVRLEPQKNIMMAIDAFHEFSRNHNDYIFEIYGDGSQRDELNSYIKNNHLEKHIFLRGRSDTIYEDIKDAYAFVLSSNYEGLSNSMLEAMALGLPVISTDYPSGGASMVIDDHVNGILIPVGGKDELVFAMNELVENPELVDFLSVNAKRIRTELSISRVLLMWNECINDIVRR